MLKLYSQFVAPGDLCFDVGANVGNRVENFLRLGATVVAVEPQIACVDAMRIKLGNHPRLTIVQKVLGAQPGQAEIMISEASVISSLSPEWIEAVKNSGRFAAYNWDQKQTVQMTTLDALIDEYGTPAFVKIDVEGFEQQVVQGLSRPVKAMSLEFTPEFLQSTFGCIEHLQELGPICLNYSLGESMQLQLDEWVTPAKMLEILGGFQGDISLFGDVYVKMTR